MQSFAAEMLSSFYFNLNVKGKYIAVRMLEDIQQVGSILIPTKRDSIEFRSCVGQVLAKGKGGFFNEKKVDHWFPGSKKWGKTTIEVPRKDYNPSHTGDFDKGDYVLFLHPFVIADSAIIQVSPDQYKKFRKVDQFEDNKVRVFFINYYEAICKLELEEGEDEERLKEISVQRISV